MLSRSVDRQEFDDLVDDWTDEQVVRRWFQIYPPTNVDWENEQIVQRLIDNEIEEPKKVQICQFKRFRMWERLPAAILQLWQKSVFSRLEAAHTRN